MDDSVPQIAIILFYALAGALCGSFVNCAAYRIPISKTLWGRSECPHCGHEIAWYDNIPILSWFLLRGRCRHCGSPIRFRYAGIEIVSAIGFGLLAWTYPPGLAAVHAIFLGITLLGALVDYDHKYLPDRVTMGGALLGLVFSVCYPSLHGTSSRGEALEIALFSAMASAGFYALVMAVAERALKKEALGFGDLKLAAMFGAFYGLDIGIGSLFVGSLLVSVVWLLASAIRGRLTVQFGQEFAFGPALIWGALIQQHFLKDHILVNVEFLRTLIR